MGMMKEVSVTEMSMVLDLVVVRLSLKDNHPWSEEAMLEGVSINEDVLWKRETMSMEWIPLLMQEVSMMELVE